MKLSLVLASMLSASMASAGEWDVYETSDCSGTPQPNYFSQGDGPDCITPIGNNEMSVKLISRESSSCTGGRYRHFTHFSGTGHLSTCRPNCNISSANDWLTFFYSYDSDAVHRQQLQRWQEADQVKCLLPWALRLRSGFLSPSL